MAAAHVRHHAAGAVAFLNLGLAVGYAPRVSFALGRYAERVGQVDAALEHYGRSLRARSTPRMESYPQHRVGLLNYTLGDEQRARDAFRRVVTTHDDSDELVQQASYYLTQLDKPPGGERVVLLLRLLGREVRVVVPLSATRSA